MTGPAFPPPQASPSRDRGLRPFRWLASVAALAAATALAGYGINQASQSSSWAPTQARPVASSDNGRSSSGSLDANAVAAQVDPAVVDINTVLSNGGQAAGTGMVLTSAGEVLTNNHVIANASDIRVQNVGTGKTYSARVLGYNVSEDVALLKVDGASGLETIATATNASVGQAVLALGNALGQGGTPDAKTGSVTATGKTITVSDESRSNQQTLSNLIQTDAALQPGDSGGPLVDANGQVVGMDAAASSGGYRFQSGGGEGYAIPIATVLAVAHQIESDNGSGDTHVGERAFLGVAIRDLGTPGRFPGGGGPRNGSGTGAVISGVQAGSPAADAGLQQGDEIVSLGGKNVSSISDLTSALAPYHPRDNVDIGWIDSSGNRHAANVTLTAGPPT